MLSVALSLSPAEARPAGRYPAPSFRGARTFLAGASSAAAARPSGEAPIGGTAPFYESVVGLSAREQNQDHANDGQDGASSDPRPLIDHEAGRRPVNPASALANPQQSNEDRKNTQDQQNRLHSAPSEWNAERPQWVESRH